MKITVPEARPFNIGRQPMQSTVPTIGQTGNAQYGRIFNPIKNQLNFYSRISTYDPESIDRVETVIEKQGFNEEDARYLRLFGIGSQDNFISALEFIQKRRDNYSVLNRSTGLNLFLTDPSLHASIAIPYGGVAASLHLGKGLNALGFQGSVRQIARAKQLMQGKNLTAQNLAKIGALDAAVVDGSITLTEALTEISEGKDPIAEIGDAALYTMGTAAVGGLLGYGIGAALNRPISAQARQATFGRRYKEYLNSVSDEPAKRGEDLSFTGEWFTNSWFMKAIPTPLRVTIQDKLLPDWAKMDMLQLGGDNGMPFAMNQLGKSVGSSAFTESARRQGDWFKALDVINQSYREVSSRNPTAEFFNVPVGEYYERIRRKLGKDSFAPDEWYNHIGRLMVDEVPYDKMTPQEAASVQAARGFFEQYGKELEEVGLINPKDLFEDNYLKNVGRQMELQSVTRSIIEQNKRWMRPQQDRLSTDIEKITNKLKSLQKTATTRGLTNKQVKFKADLEKDLVGKQNLIAQFDDAFDKIQNAKSIDELALLYKELDLTADMRNALQDLAKAMDDTRARINNAMDMIDEMPSVKSPSNYLMRIFNRRKIESDREGLKNILMNWYRENPQIIVKGDDNLFKRQELATDPVSVERRANETIDNILGETDEDAVDAIFTGFGRSGPLVSRRLNIPNHLIKDYIVTDIKEVMIAYTNRVGPRLEYHKRFRDPETGKLMPLEARIDYYRSRLIKDGVNEQTINKFIKNFVAIYDQVVGTTLKRPDAIDTKIADFLRTATSWTFLGGSGLAAIGDTASIFMDHELKSIGMSVLGSMDDISLKLSKRELNLAGEGLEITRGITHLKYMESLTNDVFSKTIPDKLNNAFYIMNGLAPITVAIKTFDGLVRGHTIIDSAIKLGVGKASKFEQEFLARYNITPKLAKQIADSPYEKSQGGLFLPNTEAWTDEAAVKAFRNALSSGVMNRVIMGTPADKPIVMSGVAYIPEHLARMLPFETSVDPRVKGYRRVESGLLALPFTFYSYTMGALSKITANHASGAVRNRLSHIAVAMGLGYMIVNTRTPNWAWKDMDLEDKIMRSFDFSGLAAIYSDAVYRGIAMASEMGFENNFPIQPKFQAPPDKIGALVSLGGAPADWSYEVLSSIGQMLSGDVQDGAKGLIRMTPLIETMATGDVIKDTAKDLTGYLPNRQ
jgi:hypothetical protein